MTIVEKYEKFVSDNDLLLTVFMLTHNREFYLKKAIDSVLSQSYKHFVLVILDNDSTDGTKEMVCSIRDNRLFYHFRLSKPGDTNSEFAKEICKTKYFIILHDDDILEKTYLEDVIRIMDNNRFDALSVSKALINEEDKVISGYCYSNDVFVFENDEYFFNKIGMINHMDNVEMVYPSVIYRTSFYKDIPCFNNADAGPAGDQYIWFDTGRRGGVIGIYDKQLIRYRRHKYQDSNISAGFMELQLLDFVLADDYYRERIDKILNNVVRYIWKAYGSVALRYNKGIIDKKTYSTVFDYNCMFVMKKCLLGKFYYLLMKTLFYMPILAKFLLKIIGKI